MATTRRDRPCLSGYLCHFLGSRDNRPTQRVMKLTDWLLVRKGLKDGHVNQHPDGISTPRGSTRPRWWNGAWTDQFSPVPTQRSFPRSAPSRPGRPADKLRVRHWWSRASVYRPTSRHQRSHLTTIRSTSPLSSPTPETILQWRRRGRAAAAQSAVQKWTIRRSRRLGGRHRR